MAEEVPLDDFDVADDASLDLTLDPESTFDRENAPLDVRTDEEPDAPSTGLQGRRMLRQAYEFAASYFRDLEKVFGARFLLLLFLVQFAIKGIVYQIGE